MIMSCCTTNDYVPLSQKYVTLTSHYKESEVDLIRKVYLTMDENQKYEIIKKLIENNGNKENASLRIGCSRRHINRMIQGYQTLSSPMGIIAISLPQRFRLKRKA